MPSSIFTSIGLRTSMKDWGPVGDAPLTPMAKKHHMAAHPICFMQIKVVAHGRPALSFTILFPPLISLRVLHHPPLFSWLADDPICRANGVPGKRGERKRADNSSQAVLGRPPLSGWERLDRVQSPPSRRGPDRGRA